MFHATSIMVSIGQLMDSPTAQRKSWSGPDAVRGFLFDQELQSLSQPEPFRSQEFLPTESPLSYKRVDEETQDSSLLVKNSLMSDRPNSSAVWDDKTVLSFGRFRRQDLQLLN